MLARRIRGLHLLHTCFQAGAILALYWAWYGLFFACTREGMPGAVWRYAAFPLPLLAGLFLHTGRATRQAVNVLELDVARAARFSLSQGVFIVGALLLFLVATKSQVISRMFLFTFLPPLYAALLVTNRGLPHLLAARMFQGARAQNTLLVGASADAQRLTAWLRRKAHLGIHAVGLVSDEEGARSAGGLPWLGKVRDLERVVRDTGATQMVLTETPLAPARLASLAELCERLGVRLVALQDFQNWLPQPITVHQDDGLCFLRVHREPLECPLNWSLKRCFDVLVALPIVLLLLPPATLLVWLLQRWQSPGPLFFRQHRHGLHNRVFAIWKFRTMHPATVLADEGRQASSGDARIFRAGSWLRRHSVDELPQFLNVLRGDMSLVGPRPHYVAHTVEFSTGVRRYHLRSLVKPGITGLAQVQALRGEIRNVRDVLRRVEWDIQYLENWSLLGDLKIVALTAWQVFVPPRSAY